MCTVVPCVSQKLYRLEMGQFVSQREKRTSRQVIKNRHRAQRISPAYATFLIVAAVCAVFICVMYLRLQADVLNRADQITALQQELTDLKESNDTAHQAAEDSVNLETVREKAMNEMGMVYESQGKVIHYQSPTSDYVKQYVTFRKRRFSAIQGCEK